MIDSRPQPSFPVLKQPRPEGGLMQFNIHRTTVRITSSIASMCSYVSRQPWLG